MQNRKSNIKLKCDPKVDHKDRISQTPFSKTDLTGKEKLPNSCLFGRNSRKIDISLIEKRRHKDLKAAPGKLCQCICTTGLEAGRLLAAVTLCLQGDYQVGLSQMAHLSFITNDPQNTILFLVSLHK